MESYTIYLPNRKAKTYWVDIIFILFGIFWLIIGKYGLGGILVIMASIGFYANRKRGVVFTREHILYPSFPQRTYTWNEVANVILKDNVLTIDLRNNKLKQTIIDKKSAGTLDEGQFNAFCQAQLGK
jgi:hypothetical protein